MNRQEEVIPASETLANLARTIMIAWKHAAEPTLPPRCYRSADVWSRA
jgi:hypothetical protein